MSTVNYINDFQVSRHFNLKEFTSPDTNEVKLDYRLVDISEQLRRELGKLIISSGYRTKSHNERVKGYKNSYHLKGLAIDIMPKEGSLRKLYLLASKIKLIGGLGLYDTHIHIDLRENKVIWVKLDRKPYRYFDDVEAALAYRSATNIAHISIG